MTYIFKKQIESGANDKGAATARTFDMTAPAMDGHEKRLLTAALILAVATSLGFALFTNQAWEDYFITVRHSINLWEGKGLTYTYGSNVQGFTSPLGVLIPALTYGLTGASSAMSALWMFRVISIAAFVSGLWFLLSSLRNSLCRNSLFAMSAASMLYCMESKSVAFTINGMETGILLFFLSGTVWVISKGATRHLFQLGIFWAGLMWTRPDSCVYIALMGIAIIAFSEESLSYTAFALLKTAAVCACIYLPWFVFAWGYYGTPIPHTVAAKSPSLGLITVVSFKNALSRLPDIWTGLYLPPYANHGGWNGFAPIAFIAGAAGSLYWMIPRADRFARTTSMIAFGGTCYLAWIPVAYPWYLPAVTMLTIPALGSSVSYILSLSEKRFVSIRYCIVTVCIILTAQAAYLLTDYAVLSRETSRIIEWEHRRSIGLWLKEHAKPGDRVFLECVGYIGFFSQLDMLDYPGITSPVVVKTRNDVGDSMALVGMALRPEWLVLRPVEIGMFENENKGWLIRHYKIAKIFDVREQFRKAAPDHPAAMYDSTFAVFKRRSEPAYSMNKPIDLILKPV